MATSKRRKKVLLVALCALIVALLTCALLFREQSPHDFLRGTERAWTVYTQSPPYKDLCETQYESNVSVSEVAERAGKELVPLGWERIGNAFYTPGKNAERIMIYADTAQSRGKTVIRIERIAKPADRFMAWLDNRLGRSPYDVVQ